MTVTHTIGVFALGLVTLALSQFIVPEQLYPWLTLVSALLVVGVGASVLLSPLRSAAGSDTTTTITGTTTTTTTATRATTITTTTTAEIDRRGLLGVGVSAGLLPCPSALVVLLAAISLHRVGFGLALILAFSVGLAAPITAIGLLAVRAKRPSAA